MLFNIIALLSVFGLSNAWVNDCGDMVTLAGKAFSLSTISDNGEVDLTFETNTTVYGSLAECRDAALADPRFDSTQYIIGFTCTFNDPDYELKMLYAGSTDPVFNTSSTDAASTSYMCNQVCTDVDTCANSGTCSSDLKYCSCDYPNHDPTCSSTKDCSCA